MKDRFQTDEINAILSYLAEPEIMNHKAIQAFLNETYCIDTYRPCYATPPFLLQSSECFAFNFL